MHILKKEKYHDVLASILEFQVCPIGIHHPFSKQCYILQCIYENVRVMKIIRVIPLIYFQLTSKVLCHTQDMTLEEDVCMPPCNLVKPIITNDTLCLEKKSVDLFEATIDNTVHALVQHSHYSNFIEKGIIDRGPNVATLAMSL